MSPPKTQEKKDWVTPLAIVVGVGGVATGLYFVLKKPPGVSPGESFKVSFSFDYLGSGGTYVLQVHLGRLYTGGIFDHIEGLGWSKTVNLPGPDSYDFPFNCPLPMGTDPKTYDGEAGIRLPNIPWDPPYNYIAGPLHKSGAVEVRKVT